MMSRLSLYGKDNSSVLHVVHDPLHGTMGDDGRFTRIEIACPETGGEAIYLDRTQLLHLMHILNVILETS